MVCYIENNHSNCQYNKIDDDTRLVYAIEFMNFVCGCVICVIAYTMYSGILSHLILYSLNDRSKNVNRHESIL